MSQNIIVPQDIGAIFSRPNWTPEERNCVKKWLNTQPQRTYLLSFALYHLGYGTTRSDADEAWGKFGLDFYRRKSRKDKGEVREQLDSVISNYDPEISPFWDYLQTCFKRFCWDEGKRIRDEAGIHVPVEQQIENEEGAIRIVEIAGKDLDPEAALMRKHLRLALQKCVNKLPSCASDRKNPCYREVVLAYYEEEKPIAEISSEIGISEGHVKVLLFRARHMLAECLRKEGWAK